MCEEKSRKTANEIRTIQEDCLVKARRKCVDEAVNFKEECGVVIDTLAEVYKFDAKAREKDMSAKQRLQYHQENSAELMDDLEVWLEEQIEQKKVEPN
mgnify:CR=1 FL=1